MPTLYVTEHGARIEKYHGRLIVRKGDEVIGSYPLIHIRDVVMLGSVGATSHALLELLDRGISLTFISSTGSIRGRLLANSSANVELRRKQYRLSNDKSYSTEISKRILTGKLLNSYTMGMRIKRSRRSVNSCQTELYATQLHRISKAIKELPGAESLEQLRGIEGAAARSYFKILRGNLRSEFNSHKRSRRPAEDPMNATLNLAYALLNNSLRTAIEICQLDPYAGFLHCDRYGRDSLALDMMEEFRPIFADSLVSGLINRKMIGPNDFDRSNMLRKSALRIFLKGYSRRLHAQVHHPHANRKISYLKVFEIQARSLRSSIESGSPDYQPFLAK